MLKQKSTFTIVRQAARSASYLELNGTVNFDLHREVYEDALNELARLNDNMFGIFKTPNKAKAKAVISQLRDYEAEMREAAQIKINTLQGTAADVVEDQDTNAFQEQIIELQLFSQMLDDKSFAVSKFISKGKMAAVTSAIDLNADVIEKAWKCKRFQRNFIIAALVTAVVAGVVFAGYKNRNKIKSVLLIDDCGTLDMDFSEQGCAEGLTLSAALLNDNDELLESVAI
jgi:hypothetical protein